MRIGELWRYPVRSMLDRHLDAVAVDDGGVRGDRADPDEVLDRGVEAGVSAPKLTLGEAVPCPTFLAGELRSGDGVRIG